MILLTQSSYAAVLGLAATASYQHFSATVSAGTGMLNAIGLRSRLSPKP
jgi:hypothetical protein